VPKEVRKKAHQGKKGSRIVESKPILPVQQGADSPKPGTLTQKRGQGHRGAKKWSTFSNG